MKVQPETVICLSVVLIAVLLFLNGGLKCFSKSGFKWKSILRSNPRPFNNSEYQYGNEGPQTEDNYYKCLMEDCKGNTHNYDCLEKCRIKSFRSAGPHNIDAQSWVCMKYRDNEDAYYKCLDNVYADYRYP